MSVENERISYDARIPRDALRTLWPLHRRSLYLLNSHCRLPLSVDSKAWPSIFTRNIEFALAEHHKRKLGLGVIMLPSWVGPLYPHWEDVSELRRYTDMHYSPFELIMVEKITEEWEEKNLTQNSLTKNGLTWEFCGFDIADDSFTSGIMSLYSELIADNVRKEMARRTNSNGLFVSIDDARNWISYIATTVPDMFPQSIYKLYITKPPTGTKRQTEPRGIF